MSFENNGFAFGDFHIDIENRTLTNGEVPVSLTPKTFDLLLELVKNHGNLVTKESLMGSVWKGSFVEDGNLTFTIGMLRKALEDDAKNPRFIETLPRRGYKFIAAINSFDTPADGSSGPANEKVGYKWRPVYLGISAILIVGLVTWLLWPRSIQKQQPSSEKVMVAILPFENLTGDADQEYLIDGLTEEMIARLGNLASDRLGVIGRTSVMHYKGGQATVDQIGRELQVQYVLEGSLRRDGDKVRISAQLIQTKDQTRVWAQEYDREITNLLSLQDEIAQAVANEIQSTIGAGSQTSPIQTSSPKNYEAYDLYLKAQYFFNKRGPENLKQAIAYFEKAVSKDPDYARAYAGLADSYALISGYTGRPQTEFVDKARASALRALEIDPNLPEAHTALALIVQNYDWDWQAAEKEFRLAIELNPNYATAHHWYAEHLAFLGRFDEALRESELARQLDPLSLIIATDNGEILYLSRRYDEAIRKLRTVQELEPGFTRSHIVIHSYVEKQMFQEALADVGEWREAVSNPWMWAEEAFIYGRSGQKEHARRALDKLLAMNDGQEMDVAPLIWASIGMGNNDQALIWLEKAYAQHSNILTSIKVDPAFDLLRGDPRFQDLLRRVGLS
ncbi:MAG: winged helix-turn-helix domain-containing protein [Acidobacteriota bacterium]